MRSDRDRSTAWGQGGNAAEPIRVRGVNADTLQNRRLKWSGSGYTPTTEVITFYEPGSTTPKTLSEGEETWVIFRSAANRYEEIAGDTGNVIYAQVVGAVGTGTPTFTFDNAIAVVGTVPTGGTGTAQNQYAQEYVDNEWVFLFQEKTSDQWLTERGGTSGSQVVYFELTQNKSYGDASKLAKPVLADGTMDSGADAFHVVDDQNQFYGRAAESGAEGYRGFALRFSDDYSEGVPGFRIITMEGPAQFLVVTLDENKASPTTDCTYVEDPSAFGLAFRGRRPAPVSAVDVKVYDDLGVATEAVSADKWIITWNEGSERYTFWQKLIPSSAAGAFFLTSEEISAATWDGTTLTLGSGDAEMMVATSPGVYEGDGIAHTIYTDAEDPIPDNTRVQCKKIDGLWVVDVQDCE